MAWFAKRTWQDEVQDRLVQQLSALQKDVSSLGKAVARSGGQVQDEASDLGEAIWHGGEAVARQLTREAQRLGKAVRDDPMPAIVAVVAMVGVVAALSIAFSRR